MQPVSKLSSDYLPSHIKSPSPTVSNLNDEERGYEKRASIVRFPEWSDDLVVRTISADGESAYPEGGMQAWLVVFGVCLPLFARYTLPTHHLGNV